MSIEIAFVQHLACGHDQVVIPWSDLFSQIVTCTAVALGIVLETHEP